MNRPWAILDLRKTYKTPLQDALGPPTGSTRPPYSIHWTCHADNGPPRKRTPRIVIGNDSCRFRSPGSITGDLNAAVCYPPRPETVPHLGKHSLSAEIEVILFLRSQWKSISFPPRPETVPLLENHSLSAEIEVILLLRSQSKSNCKVGCLYVWL